MPELARLLNEGSSGPLRTEQPPLSPLLWTTMLTGRGPLEHGILDFTRFDPTTGQRQPITSAERRVPAVWNIASAAKRTVGVFGLWATHPAEPVNGTLVSDRLFSFQHRQAAPPSRFAYPEAAAANALRALAAADAAIDCPRLRHFVADLTVEECEEARVAEDPYARPISGLRRILVETEVYDRLARAWLAEGTPDLTILYLQGTDAIGHVFARFAPPRLASVGEREYQRFSGVPALYFAEVDRLLGEYRRLAERQGAALLLASDHGFAWGDGRPEALSSLAMATAAKWHRSDGIYLLWRPAAVPSPRRGSAGEPGEIRRVAATLLALLDLPSGTAISGPPLLGLAPSIRPAVDYDGIAWRSTPSEAVGQSPATPADESDLAALRSLGYLGGGEASRAPSDRRGSTRTAASFNNQGLILEDLGRRDEAAGAYEEALRVDPGYASAAWNLSHLLDERGLEAARADRLLIDALRGGLPEGERQVIERAVRVQRGGDLPRAERLVGSALEVAPRNSELWLFRGRYRIEAGRCREALADFERAATLAPERAAVWSASGLARLCLGDTERARRDLGRSLAIDPAQPQVRDFLDRLGAS